MAKRMYLSNQNKVLAGVAGGLGEYFDIDPVLIRIAFVVLIFLNGFGLLAYVVAWIWYSCCSALGTGLNGNISGPS